MEGRVGWWRVWRPEGVLNKIKNVTTILRFEIIIRNDAKLMLYHCLKKVKPELISYTCLE